MRFKPSDHVKLALILCVTIGLTPYFPVPHSYEKLKWLFDGANDMQALDYADLVFHNIPWVYFIIATIYWLNTRKKRSLV
jgi:hypothetical protein